MYDPLDLWDELATARAEVDDFAGAVEAQRRVVEAGYDRPPDPRAMLAWYLLKAGEHVEGDALWAELLAQAPEDASLLSARAAGSPTAGARRSRSRSRRHSGRGWS